MTVYVLKSQQGGGHYVGMTNDLTRRLREHNRGMTRSTRSRRPFEVVYVEEYEDREAARRREKYLKTAAGRRFLKKLAP
ncbi:MAG: GIY-YIG nuclease family protein [Ignavibacteriales bacterium]|nr:GIY-YIG nuclease family protein [Ignavibacteriales bacterium]